MQQFLIPYFYKGVIYCVENIQNHKKYIGKTSVKNYFKYIENHFKNAFKSENQWKDFYKAIVKFGKENFKIIILGEIYEDSKEKLFASLNQAEIDCIYHFRTFGYDNIHKDDIYGYNMTKGGDGGRGVSSPRFGKDNANYNNKWSLKQKQNLSIYLKENHIHKGKNNPRYIETDKTIIDQIIKLYNIDKISRRRISKLLNISFNRITRILKENNIYLRNLPESCIEIYKNKKPYNYIFIDIETQKQIIDLYINKYKNAKLISNLLNVSMGTVYKTLKENSIKRR